MTRVITDKLVATVLEVTDLDELFPTPTLRGRIGLDIRVEQGSLSTGKKVLLHGVGSEEEVEIVGIEMRSNPHDPNVVRILCSKPRMLAVPTGKVEGWMVREK